MFTVIPFTNDTFPEISNRNVKMYTLSDITAALEQVESLPKQSRKRKRKRNAAGGKGTMDERIRMERKLEEDNHPKLRDLAPQNACTGISRREVTVSIPSASPRQLAARQTLPPTHYGVLARCEELTRSVACRRGHITVRILLSFQSVQSILSVVATS